MCGSRGGGGCDRVVGERVNVHLGPKKNEKKKGEEVGRTKKSECAFGSDTKKI